MVQRKMVDSNNENKMHKSIKVIETEYADNDITFGTMKDGRFE